MEHVPAWLGVPCLVLVLAFIAFAFRQGFKVRPRRGDNSTSDAISLINDNSAHHR